MVIALVCILGALIVAEKSRGADPSAVNSQCRSEADSVVATRMAEGRYTCVSRFLECVQQRHPGARSLAAPREFCGLFSRLHPVARIADSVQVSQLIELAYNTFTLVDSQAVYLTVGDADTYSAWFLQRVLGMRSDILVIALPFLIGSDYREELCRDLHFQRAFGWDKADSLPVPLTTAETDSSRTALVQRWRSCGKRTPLYFSPMCGLDKQLEGRVAYVGLSHTYVDSTINPDAIVTELLQKMKSSWRMAEASHGMPSQEEALKNGMIQYLSLAIMMVSRFQQSGRSSELDGFFDLLGPVCSNNWRFNALRYTYGTGQTADREKYLNRVKEYSKAHSEDRVALQFLEQAKE
jgi:hypothetical protein